MSDRQALEAENRHLAWKAGNRQGGESRGIATDRLDVIDGRLAGSKSISGGSSPSGRASDPPLASPPSASPESLTGYWSESSPILSSARGLSFGPTGFVDACGAIRAEPRPHHALCRNWRLRVPRTHAVLRPLRLSTPAPRRPFKFRAEAAPRYPRQARRREHAASAGARARRDECPVAVLSCALERIVVPRETAMRGRRRSHRLVSDIEIGR